MRRSEGTHITLPTRWTYIMGPNSASSKNIEYLLGGINGIPAVRWKSDDLLQSRRGNEFLPKCYMCSGRIDPSGTQAERPRLCAQCETLNRLKRSASPDLSSVVAVVTGGRCKIGFATALRLLRLGATVAISTRFPRGAAGRYAREPDSAEWLSRLTIFGVDFSPPGPYR